MPALQIVLDGDGAAQKVYTGRQISELQALNLDAVTGLAGGTASGAPSVGFLLSNNGDVYFAQTTLKLFLTAADALKARYGDPR